MPAHKGGYGCYAIVCSTFLIIFGFGLGFIVGYFVLNKPVVKKPALSSRYITESKGLHLLEEVANNTQFDYPETEFAKFIKFYLNLDHHTISNFTYEELAGFDSVHKSAHRILIPMKNSTFKITDMRRNLIFETKFDNIDENFGVAYCPSRDMTLNTVFVNYATEEDFVTLRQYAIDIKNKIFVARCGKIHLDNMIKNCEINGAKALLYFVDSPRVEQRACSSFSIYSVQNKEKPRELQPQVIKIPVHQIDVEDVEKIFQVDSRGIWNRKILNKWNIPFAVEGPPNLEQLKYYKTELNIQSSLIEATILNVVAKIYGQTEPDRYIIIGCHHNYMRSSELDPGTRNLLQVAKLFKKLTQTGWRPRRTIIFANFDARNYGYIGGQQWLEQNLDDISAKTSLYINMPACSDGSSNMEASFSTVDALFDAVETVNKTNMNFSVTLDQLGIDFRNRNNTQQHKGYTEISTFGYYAGIPFVNFGNDILCEEDENSTSLAPCNHVVATLAVKFADSTILPLNLKNLASKMKQQFESLFYFDSLYTKRLHANYDINVADLRRSILKFQQEVEIFQKQIENMKILESLPARIVNDLLMRVERKLILHDEVSHHLYRHSVFAPLSTNLLIVEGFQDILNLSNEEDKQKLSFHMTNVVKSINEAAEVLKSVRIPNP